MPRKEYNPRLTGKHIQMLEEEKVWDYEKAKDFAKATDVPIRSVIAKLATLPGVSYTKKPPYKKKTDLTPNRYYVSLIEDACGEPLPALSRVPKTQLMILLENLTKK